TVRQRLDNLSGVLTVAVEEGWLEHNPLRRVTKPPQTPSRVRFLSAEERTRLLEECQCSGTRALYPIVLLALTTGARKTEIRTLRWRDVDLDRGFLRLIRTKNGERRAVPMPQMTRDVLVAWRVAPRGPWGATDTAWVFPGTQSSGPLDFKRAWYAARR